MNRFVIIFVLLLGIVRAMDCTVDDTADQASPSYGRSMFATMQEAIAADWCDSIFVRFTDTSAYYENIIVINQSNARVR